MALGGIPCPTPGPVTMLTPIGSDPEVEALLPETIAGVRAPDISVVRLTEPEICWELVVAYLKTGDGVHGNGAADALLQMLQYYE